MKRKLIGTRISFFGFGITVSSIVHPLGFMENQLVFYVMLILGAFLLLTGKVIGNKGKVNEIANTRSQ